MIDIEKVRKGLKCCSNTGKGRCESSECPYWIVSTCCIDEMQRDALALLKEQEAKPPAIMQDIEGIWSTCSMCGHKLRPILSMKMDTYFPKFCPECGQAVKWK